MAESVRELAESNCCAQDLVKGTSVKDLVSCFTADCSRQIMEVDVAV